MKKILFFFEDNWAFGNIHHAVSRELYSRGFICSVLDWNSNLSKEEFKMLDDVYDLFVTIPSVVNTLVDYYEIDKKKIVAFAHGQWDLYKAKEQGCDYYEELAGFAVISQTLKNVASSISGRLVDPKVCKIGIHTSLYKSKAPEALSVIGYGGSIHHVNYAGIDIKRGHLVETACKLAGVEFAPPRHKYKNLSMPAYYKTVDCVIMSSLEEAGGLPLMEASAASRLPIGTPAGYFGEYENTFHGVLVPYDEKEFVECTAYALSFFKSNSLAFKEHCQNANEFALNNYDWKNVIEDWVDLLNGNK